MFRRTPDPEDTHLQRAIDAVYARMYVINPGSEEHGKLADSLTKLYALKQTKKRMSPDTRGMIIANLAGIAMILAHEHSHVITSKATNFVMKAR